MNERPDALVGKEVDEKKRLMKRLAVSPSWTALYRDNETGALWRESFPWGEAHGGGPSTLERISEREALLEFDITEDDLRDLRR